MKAYEVGDHLNNALDGYLNLTAQWQSAVGSEINDSGKGIETVNCLLECDPDQQKYLLPPAHRTQK